MLPQRLVAMYTLRYSITTRSLQSGAEFRVVQGLLGPVDVSTRMIDRHAMQVAGVATSQGYLVALLPKSAPFDGRR